MAEKFYITTAIAYTSRKPHIGNVYEAIFTDAIARYHRLKGEDVFFLTGTDEHGQKIEEAAKEMGIAPKEYVDNVSAQVKSMWDLVGTSYDKFIRTTDPQHEKTVQKIFKKLFDQGDIYKGTYEGMYCTPCEAFFTETQLVNGKCPDCGREVKPESEEAYFFKMSKYQDRLMRYIEEHPNFIMPDSRRKEMVNNFLKPGLQDLCVSRTTFSWGIPVDFDPKHVVYVWIDALSNYITALGYDPDGSSELFKKFWPADVHVIGKDILRFHTIYWPIMLMALDLPLPKQIFGHPWVLFNKEKMSKSRGNVIYPDDLAEHFGVDAERYYMLSEMPYGQDGNATFETVCERYNSDLANTLGNLVNRVVAMGNKYFDSTIINTGIKDAIDNDLIECYDQSVSNYIMQMESLHLADAIESIMLLARRANKYVDETAPWVLAKSDETKPRLSTVLFNLIECIRSIAVMITPFMPETGKKIFEQINTSEQTLESITDFGSLHGVDTYHVGVATPLFERIDTAKKLEEIEIALTKKYPVIEPEEEKISIDDFKKVSLQVMEIMSCENIEKSDKLYKLMLNDGKKNRQVVSGIAKFYTKEELIGKKVIAVSNLAPVKLRGVDSNGMILAGDCGEDINVIFVDKNIANGTKLR